MPFYRYCCSDCSFDENVFIEIGRKLEECPSCLSKNIVKKIGKFYTSGHSEVSKSKLNVDKFIRDSKEDLKTQKDSLKDRVK